ncbi:hypothetical protein [Streptacidiphilus jiangxiensis]|uniref:Uncharacterized protein n=1 Tax=Streptacidiphilus jiangxiensis TaxID=235985 RepID=A0A1H7TM82_STRJI|nr:hypothetical protein [Streptacidiphilus jiangxiensis]SEL85466.1 hypothetical protein SAMN05414137_11452 [Streptacidiphilus jiangxiensis]
MTTSPDDYDSTNCVWCGAAVQLGPEGGYVCGQCAYTVTPPGYERRAADERDRLRTRRHAKSHR